MFANGVETCTTTGGTGTVLLLSVTGRPHPSHVWGASGTRLIEYSINDDTNGKYEWGIGTLTLPASLARTKIKATFDVSVYDDINPSAVSLAASGITVLIAPHDDSRIPTMPFFNGSTAATSLGLGSMHSTQFTNTGNFSLSNATLLFMPFLWTGQCDITRATIRVVTNQAATSVDMGIYEMAKTGLPGNLLVSVGTFPLDNAGIVAITGAPFPLKLPPGWYYIGQLSNSSTGTGRATGAINHITPAGIGSFDPITDYTKPLAYSSGLPAVAPPATSLTGNTGRGIPTLFLTPRNE